MRQVQYKNHDIVLSEIQERIIERPGDVKIRIAYSGICGSDLHLAKGDLDEDLRVKESQDNGLDIGHEASGYVVEMGKVIHSEKIKEGDKVALYFNCYCGKCFNCRSGMEHYCSNIRMIDNFMSDYTIVDEQMIYPLPKDFDMRRAALIEPISVCLHGIDMCNIKPGKTLAISGAGGIGHIIMQLGINSGAVNITVFEPVEKKRTYALEAGAQYAINPMDKNFYESVMSITKGRGFDYIIECSGAESAIGGCFKVLSRGGTLELMAIYKSECTLKSISTKEGFLKEAKIIAGVYQSPYTIYRAIEIANTMNVDCLINSIFEPEQVAKAFEAQIKGETIKSMIHFSD